MGKHRIVYVTLALSCVLAIWLTGCGNPDYSRPYDEAINADQAKVLENARKAGVSDRVTFRNEDLFEADIREATVVTLFLWQSVNLKLRAKLWRDLKPGTRVVSHHWDMDDWKPEKSIQADGHPIYFWTIPRDAASRAR